MFARIFEYKFANLDQAKIAANHLSVELGEKIEKFNINSLSITMENAQVFRLCANSKKIATCKNLRNLHLRYSNRCSKLSHLRQVGSRGSLFLIMRVKPPWRL